MATRTVPVLTQKQLADYDELGFADAILILSEDEVRRFRAEVERTRQAIGDRVTRLNALHMFFRWAWQLSTHPRLLDCMEQLIGPNILLKSTRLFYKPGGSASFVGWHQDGITERLEDERVPAVWLGLTDATVENGCLRVVLRSHRLGLVPHRNRPDNNNLTTEGVTAEARIDSVYDVVMRAGEMSIHHPLVLHASSPNRSSGPRIGFTATYATPALRSSRTPVAWVRGDGPRDCFEIIGEPDVVPFEAEVAAYLARDQQIHFAGPDTPYEMY